MTPGSSTLRAEIGAKWGKLTSEEVSALKDNNDLVAQIQSKYHLDKAQAQKDVDVFANGRSLSDLTSR